MQLTSYAKLALAGGLSLTTSQTQPSEAGVGEVFLHDDRLWLGVPMAGIDFPLPITHEVRKYVHSQGAASSAWVVNHGLDTLGDMIVLALDTDGNPIIPTGTVANSANQLTISFSAQKVGHAVLVPKSDLSAQTGHFGRVSIGTAVLTDSGGVLAVGGTQVSLAGHAHPELVISSTTQVPEGANLYFTDIRAAAAAAAAASSANVASKLVIRDASGNFSAGTVTAALAGNASTASKIAAAVAIALSGDASGTVNFDGSAGVSIPVTLANTAVTAGSYGSSIAVGTFTVDAKGRLTAAASTTIRSASTTQTGVVQLNSTINSTSTTQAATASAVKTAYDLAAAAIPATQKGAANGVATLDASGLIPTSQLPSYVSDVIEAATVSALPATGQGSKIYVTTDTGKIYRWSGSLYIEISPTAGNADSATRLAAARLINGIAFDGTGDITIKASTTNALTIGSYLTGGTFDGGSAVTIAVDAASANTASKVVARDASGNFAAGTITAALNGNAATASKWATARTITINGDIGGTLLVDGSSDGTLTLTLGNSGATAGTYRSVTVDAKGRVTAGSNPTTLAGYGITDAAPSSHVGSTGTAHGVATASVAGFMSSAHFTKLQNISLLTLPDFPSSYSGIANFLLRVNGSSSAVEAVDGTTLFPGKTGTGASGTWNIGITGNAATASKLANAYAIILGGDAGGSVAFDGSQNVALNVTLPATGVTAGSYGLVTVDAKGRVTAGSNPTTLAGYGIADAYTKVESDARFELAALTQRLRKTTATQSTTSTTIGTVIAGMSATLAANKVYQFTAVIRYQTAANGTGIAVTTFVPSGTTVAAMVDIGIRADQVGSNFQGMITASTDTVTGTGVVAANTMQVLKIVGNVVVGATAGTLDFAFGSEVSGSAASVLAGSTVIVEEIP